MTKVIDFIKSKTIDRRKARLLYKVLSNMWRRCYMSDTDMYKYYGARGINVCDNWLLSFIAFYEWAMISGYKEGLQIDRINNDGNYEPENCRWVTCKENSKNTRHNVFFEYGGEKLTLTDMAIKHGLCVQTLARRIKTGWDIKDALTIRPDKRYHTCKKGQIQRRTIHPKTP